MLSKNQSLRSVAQDILRLKIAHWLPEKQERFIQFCMRGLQEGCTNDRVIALEMLGLMEEKVPVETFLPFLNESKTVIRLAALEQLRKRGQQGSKFPIEPLADLLSDPDARVRWGSIAALDAQEEDVPVDLLIAAMHDANESIIHYATSILGRRRVVDAIPELLEQLLTDPNDFWMDYTDSAVAAIEELYKHVPLERLLNALSSETEKIRFRAITLLSLLKERTPVELLLKLLDDKDPAMRRQVVIALQALGIG